MSEQDGDVVKAVQKNLQDMKPLGAKYYSLANYSDGKATRYPASGAFCLQPFEFPKDVPNGTYHVAYHVDADHPVNLPSSVRHANPLLAVTWAHPALPTTQLAKAQQQPTAPQQLSLQQRLLQEPEFIESRIDYAKQVMAHKLQTRTQKAVREGFYTKEVQENHALMQAMRHELQQAYEIMMALSRRQAEQAAHLADNIDRTQELLSRTIAQAKEHLQTLATPPPPPDYTGAIMSGCTMLRDVFVAMIQAKAGTKSIESPKDSEVVRAKLIPEKESSDASKAPQEQPKPTAETVKPAAVPDSKATTSAKPEPATKGAPAVPPDKPDGPSSGSADLGELVNQFASACEADEPIQQAKPPALEPVTVAPVPTLVDPKDPKRTEEARRVIASFASLDELLQTVLLFNPALAESFAPNANNDRGR